MANLSLDFQTIVRRYAEIILTEHRSREGEGGMGGRGRGRSVPRLNLKDQSGAGVLGGFYYFIIIFLFFYFCFYCYFFLFLLFCFIFFYFFFLGSKYEKMGIVFKFATGLKDRDQKVILTEEEGEKVSFFFHILFFFLHN